MYLWSLSVVFTNLYDKNPTKEVYVKNMLTYFVSAHHMEASAHVLEEFRGATLIEYIDYKKNDDITNITNNRKFM